MGTNPSQRAARATGPLGGCTPPTQRAARAEILPGLSTGIWGYNGVFPGPTIVSDRGRRTVVTHTNELPVPTVVHLHGGRTPAEHDGYPDPSEAHEGVFADEAP